MVDARVRLPAHLVAEAEEFASLRRTPAEARQAATVLLLRDLPGDQPGSVELYLLRRQTSMAFAGGMFVFPGGGVDRRDFDATVAWAGPDPQEWAKQLGTDAETARALVIAAVRETFEESGVLLAGASASEVVADTTGADWEADRWALESRELAMTDFLSRRGLLIRSDLLGAWQAWTTPIFEPRRYATWFFVAQLPQGQRTRDVSTESDAVTWASAVDAMAGFEAGSVAMLPPTYGSCLDVAQYRNPAEVLAAAQGRVLEMFTPQVQDEDGVAMLSVPPDMMRLMAARQLS